MFVVDEGRQIADTATLKMRVVVRGGHVVEASSLQYGGTAPIQYAPTIETMFDRAEQIATFGEDGVPVRFDAHYDPATGHPTIVDADGRESFADDESRFEISCFSINLTAGCRPIPITKAQCRRAGGFVRADERGCDAGWSIGLVNETEICCRTFSEVSYDELTAAQCRAASGTETACTSDMLPVGSSQKRNAYCCRRFLQGRTELTNLLRP